MLECLFSWSQLRNFPQLFCRFPDKSFSYAKKKWVNFLIFLLRSPIVWDLARCYVWLFVSFGFQNISTKVLILEPWQQPQFNSFDWDNNRCCNCLFFGSWSFLSVKTNISIFWDCSSDNRFGDAKILFIALIIRFIETFLHLPFCM